MTVAVSALGAAVASGLGGQPKGLPPRYFYDEEGSRLYEEITKLPEYYLTRAEAGILQEYGRQIVSQAGAFDQLVELGSGSSEKTRFLLDAMRLLWPVAEYHPVDISESAIGDSTQALRADYPGMTVVGHVGEYRDVLEGLDARADGRRFVVFLGSSIGNFSQREADAFLDGLHDFMHEGEPFLVGTDLAKDPKVLEAAYNDSQGVTARFNLNILARINRELGGRFDLSAFRHKAFYNREKTRIEMHLVSVRNQRVRVDALDETFAFVRGETIHTENSYKFTPEAVASMADRAGFSVERTWTDAGKRFALNLWRRG